MSVPTEMRAMQCTDYGKLVEATLPVPTPAAGEVLVKVASVSINPVDYKVFEGHIGLNKPHPFTPGCDLAGTVVAVGEGVKDFKVGDEVFGMTGSLGRGPQGTLAEYAIAWEPMLARKPKNISLHDASSVALALETAWEGTMDRVHIKKNDHVLITGASGAVGLFALQLAVLQGARVYGLASEGKRDLVEKYGATFIDYKKGLGELERVAKESTPNGRGFDVIYESVGGETLTKVFTLVAPHGAIATINAFAPQDLTALATKGALVCFPLTCLPFLYPEDQNKHYMGGLLREALPLIAEGKLEVLVDREHGFPFSKDGVLAAFEMQKNNKNRGKLVIDVAKE